MPRGIWDAKAKALVVIESLQSKSVAEICPSIRLQAISKLE